MTESPRPPEVADERVAAALARVGATAEPTDQVAALSGLAEDLQAILTGRSMDEQLG